MAYAVDLESQQRLNIVLLKDLKNVADLRKMIMSGEIDCCVVKPYLIVDPFQIAVAANKAVVSKLQNKMATKKVYTEVLFNLSMTKNISKALIQFGIGDDDKNLLICTIGDEEDLEKVLSNVQGERCSIKDLSELCDEAEVKKHYKITDTEMTVSTLLDSVVSRIVAKEFGVF